MRRSFQQSIWDGAHSKRKRPRDPISPVTVRPEPVPAERGELKLTVVARNAGERVESIESLGLTFIDESATAMGLSSVHKQVDESLSKSQLSVDLGSRRTTLRGRTTVHRLGPACHRRSHRVRAGPLRTIFPVTRRTRQCRQAAPRRDRQRRGSVRPTWPPLGRAKRTEASPPANQTKVRRPSNPTEIHSQPWGQPWGRDGDKTDPL